MVKIMGKIITISISKTKNSTAIKKNWDEKGIRGDLLGSNPHSNGDIFSRFLYDFFLKIKHIIINNLEIMDANVNDKIIL